MNHNSLSSGSFRKYDSLFLNSRSVVFLSSPHFSSCEICAQKDNRITFSQDRICFAEHIPAAGHLPAAGDPGGWEPEALTSQFKPQSTADFHLGFRGVIIFILFLDTGADRPPTPRDKNKQNGFCLPKDATSACVSHLKLLSIWLTHLCIPPVDR